MAKVKENREPKHLGYWGRKIFHVLLNTFFAILVFFLPVTWILPTTVFVVVSMTLIEYVRLKTFAKKYFDQTVGIMYKELEHIEHSSMFWGGVGGLIVAFFAEPIAISFGLFALAYSDTMANIIGKYIKSPLLIRKKTLAGVAACFLTTLFITICFQFFVIEPSIAWYWYIIIPSVVTLMEVQSYPFDDNLTILVSATIMMHMILI